MVPTGSSRFKLGRIGFNFPTGSKWIKLFPNGTNRLKLARKGSNQFAVAEARATMRLRQLVDPIRVRRRAPPTATPERECNEKRMRASARILFSYKSSKMRLSRWSIFELATRDPAHRLSRDQSIQKTCDFLTQAQSMRHYEEKKKKGGKRHFFAIYIYFFLFLF